MSDEQIRRILIERKREKTRERKELRNIILSGTALVVGTIPMLYLLASIPV